MTDSPILLIHGAVADNRSWDLVRAQLPSGLNIVAPDLTYHGFQPWPDNGDGYGVPVQANDIARAAVAAGQPVHLVCLSMSCLAGLVVVLRRPDLFRSAFFYEPSIISYIEDAQTRGEFVAGMQEIIGPVLERHRQDGPVAALSLLTEGRLEHMTPDRQAVGLDNLATLRFVLGGHKSARIAPAAMRSIRLPTCFAMGSDTRVPYAISTRSAAALVPGSQLLVIDGADHFAAEDEPARFADALRGWLGSR